MNEGRELSYEQPLAPGEARLDAGRESVTIAWRMPLPVIRREIVWSNIGLGYFVIRFAVACNLSMKGRHSPLPVLWGPAVVFFLVLLIREIRLGHLAFVINANREGLSRSNPTAWRVETLPMRAVQEFVVESGSKGHTLVARGRPRARAHTCRHKLPWRLRPMSLPAKLLTHTDLEFVTCAANALNALLAPSDDLAATFSPPPPSPDPPS